jgi:hypothetical protein
VREGQDRDFRSGCSSVDGRRTPSLSLSLSSRARTAPSPNLHSKKASLSLSTHGAEPSVAANLDPPDESEGVHLTLVGGGGAPLVSDDGPDTTRAAFFATLRYCTVRVREVDAVRRVAFPARELIAYAPPSLLLSRRNLARLAPLCRMMPRTRLTVTTTTVTHERTMILLSALEPFQLLTAISSM